MKFLTRILQQLGGMLREILVGVGVLTVIALIIYFLMNKYGIDLGG